MMRKIRNSQKAFTLIEVLVTLVIVLILAGALVGTGKYLRTRAERQLTQSEIEVICTALELYYDEYGVFPFETYADFGKINYGVIPVLAPGTVSGGDTEEKIKDPVDNKYESNASSAALFYYLNRNKNCRQIIEAISERLITNKDAQTGARLKVLVGAPPIEVDLPRFIDAWGTALRYTYQSGDVFPVIFSAGPDKKFDTKDDLSSQ